MQNSKIENKLIDILMPEIYSGMAIAKITYWIFEEDEVDVIDPEDTLLRVETEKAYFDVQVPPWITTQCRVKVIHKHAGEDAAPGDVLLSIEPINH